MGIRDAYCSADWLGDDIGSYFRGRPRERWRRLTNSASSTIQNEPKSSSYRTKHLWSDKLVRMAFWIHYVDQSREKKEKGEKKTKREKHTNWKKKKDPKTEEKIAYENKRSRKKIRLRATSILFWQYYRFVFYLVDSCWHPYVQSTWQYVCVYIYIYNIWKEKREKENANRNKCQKRLPESRVNENYGWTYPVIQRWGRLL